MAELIYKIVDRNHWAEAVDAGTFHGSKVDIDDGYIHFSTGKQLPETVAKHFADKNDLWIVAVDPDKLGQILRFEVSRNNDMFPHLYGQLNVADVEWHHAFTCAECDVFEQPRDCGH